LLEPILNAVDAEVEVSDDADAFKKVVIDGTFQQVNARAHVGINTDDR
jgi:hypothetical protein